MIESLSSGFSALTLGLRDVRAVTVGLGPQGL